MTSETWTKAWPTKPGWYWTRRGSRRPSPGRVTIGGTGNGSHLVYLVDGAFAYEGECYWHDLEWGPHIPEPQP